STDILAYAPFLFLTAFFLSSSCPSRDNLSARTACGTHAVLFVERHLTALFVLMDSRTQENSAGKRAAGVSSTHPKSYAYPIAAVPMLPPIRTLKRWSLRCSIRTPTLGLPHAKSKLTKCNVLSTHIASSLVALGRPTSSTMAPFGASNTAIASRTIRCASAEHKHATSLFSTTLSRSLNTHVFAVMSPPVYFRCRWDRFVSLMMAAPALCWSFFFHPRGLLLVLLEPLFDRLLRLDDSPFEAPHARTKGADRQILDAYSPVPTALEPTLRLPVLHTHATVAHHAADLADGYVPAPQVLDERYAELAWGLGVDDQSGHDLTDKLGVVGSLFVPPTLITAPSIVSPGS